MGIAQTTSQNISDIIFAIGYTDILDLILAQNAPLVDSGLHNECSTFLLQRETQVLCGQNWDNKDDKSRKTALGDYCSIISIKSKLGKLILEQIEFLRKENRLKEKCHKEKSVMG